MLLSRNSGYVWDNGVELERLANADWNIIQLLSDISANYLPRRWEMPCTYTSSLFSVRPRVIIMLHYHFPGGLSYVSIITQVIIEIRALPLAENGVIFRYNQLRGGEYSGRLAFCGCAWRGN